MTYTWSQITTIPLAEDIKTSFISENGQNIVIIDNHSGSYLIKKSSNAGSSWSDVASPDQAGIRRFYASTSPSINTMVINGYQDLWISEDGGGTWAASSLGDAFYNACVSADGNTVYGTYYPTQVIKRWRKGIGWDEIASPVGDPRYVSCSGDGSVILVGGFGATQLSTNGGASWMALSGFDYKFWNAMSNDGRIMFIGRPGMFNESAPEQVQISSDYGTTWGGFSYPTWSMSSFGFSGDGTVIYAGRGWDNMYLTEDLGSTWIPIFETSGNNGFNSIAPSTDGRKLFLGGSYGVTSQYGDAGGTPPARLLSPFPISLPSV